MEDREPLTIDIDDVPELSRVVDEVLRSGQPCVLRRKGARVAELRVADPSGEAEVPVTEPPADPIWEIILKTLREARQASHPRTTAEKRAVLREVAGSWAHVDTDEFIRGIYQRRDSAPPSPPLVL